MTVESESHADLPGGNAVGRVQLSDVLQARRPALCFVANIGDALLTLPTLRALGEMFAAPITLICPKVVFDLCFREVSHLHVDTTGLPLTGPQPLPGAPLRAIDHKTLAAQIGAVDVFIDTLTWNSLSSTVIRPLVDCLAPTTTIGFPTTCGYDIVVTKEECHSADLTFKLARLFDPSLRIETYAQPLPLPSSVQEQAQSIRAAVPAGMNVLAVHADTNWAKKRWPATRFIDLLDRFLSRHRDFVAWIVGMGHEELNVGRERERVFPYLGLPLDLAMGMVSRADLFLGVDSAMLHAADLARVPGIGLFGPTNSATWGFRFGPHRHVDMSTMADITVEAALAALEDLIESAPTRQ
ncbi:glycosyltransferase family 9 protein [Mycobacterium sp. ML4]